MKNLLTLFVHEPRALGATGPALRDWALVAAIVSLCIVEGVLRTEIAWRPLAVGLCVALAVMTPWRRKNTLAIVVVAFGSVSIIQTFALVRDVEFTGLNTSLFMLILPYALLRWASGYEVLLGFLVIAVSFGLAMPGQGGWSEGVGAGLFLLFPAALGASVRYRDSAHRRAVEQVRMGERERIARDLHDSVAHHVSAIAVQAQAGLARAETHPSAPREALLIIEEAASRTLSEMRHTVSTLRDGDDEMSTQVTPLMDIKRFANTSSSTLQIDVVLTGVLDNLEPALCTTLFQLTREALTNAEKHARGAHKINVQIIGEDTLVRLRIVDDGELVAAIGSDGFGLRGMAERVSLLGGTMHAGPGNPRGWTTEVALPKRGFGA